jgi:hypothetical protein
VVHAPYYTDDLGLGGEGTAVGAARKVVEGKQSLHRAMVGRCRLTVSKPELKSRLVSVRLKLKCNELLSNFAFKLNLRRYTMEGRSAEGEILAMVETLADVDARAAAHGPVWLATGAALPPDYDPLPDLADAAGVHEDEDHADREEDDDDREDEDEGEGGERERGDSDEEEGDEEEGPDPDAGRDPFSAADKARVQKNTEAKRAAPKFNYTRLQSLMFSYWRAWVHRYPTVVLGKLRAVAAAHQLPAVDESADRWAGVFTADPDKPPAVPNQRAWEHIKTGTPADRCFYHYYCMNAHVDRLFTG